MTEGQVGLIVEMFRADISAWVQAGALKIGDQPGSLSDCHDGTRDLIIFRCEGDHSAVCLSAGGADFELGDVRTIVTDGLEELASLGPGESFERDVTTDRGLSCRVRWTHVG